MLNAWRSWHLATPVQSLALATSTLSLFGLQVPWPYFNGVARWRLVLPAAPTRRSRLNLLLLA